MVAVHSEKTKSLRECLSKEICQYEKQGQTLPPVAMYGLRTAGGWPFQSFARQMRAIPEWKSCWETIAKIDGRHCDALPHYATLEPVAVTHEKDSFTSLKGHRDNKLVPGAPEIFANQSLGLLCPPLLHYLRTGCFTTFLPVTNALYEDRLRSVICRYSETETGIVSRAPQVYGLPKCVFGGSYIGLAKAREMSCEELEEWQCNNLQKDMSALIPSKPAPQALRRTVIKNIFKLCETCGGRGGGKHFVMLSNSFEQATVHVRELLEKAVESTCGPLIRTERKLKSEAAGNSAEGSKRKLLLRAIAGGVESKHIWRICRGAPVKVAQDVFSQAQRLADCSMIARWIANSGKRKRSADMVWQQPLGEALKRKK